MGQAKRRGSYDDRKANAAHHHRQWEQDYMPKHKIAVTNGESDTPPNEWLIRNFIIKKDPKAINPHWVYWMLALLYEAHKSGQPINELLLNHPLSKREPLMEAQSQGTD